MSSIPPDILEKILSDPFYERSCLSGATVDIQKHHCLQYAGKKVQALFALLPLTAEEHRNANRPDIKRKLEKIMLSRATPKEKQKITSGFFVFPRGNIYATTNDKNQTAIRQQNVVRA